MEEAAIRIAEEVFALNQASRPNKNTGDGLSILDLVLRFVLPGKYSKNIIMQTGVRD